MLLLVLFCLIFLTQITDDDEFVCQHGPVVKVIRKGNVGIKTEQGDDEDFKSNFKTSFVITKTIEAELDDILSFDTCLVSKVVITAHKSNLLRIWCLISGQLLKTIKSLHNMPIGYIEICKAQSLKNIKGVLSSNELDAIEGARIQLCWISISGAAVKLWQLGGNQMSKLIRVENITALGYARWENTTLYTAERNIYVMGIQPETKQFGVLKTLEGHYSQVTGIEFTTDNLMLR